VVVLREVLQSQQINQYPDNVSILLKKIAVLFAMIGVPCNQSDWWLTDSCSALKK
jgi:hypothetical protein